MGSQTEPDLRPIGIGELEGLLQTGIYFPHEFRFAQEVPILNRKKARALQKLYPYDVEISNMVLTIGGDGSNAIYARRVMRRDILKALGLYDTAGFSGPVERISSFAELIKYLRQVAYDRFARDWMQWRGHYTHPVEISVNPNTLRFFLGQPDEALPGSNENSIITPCRAEFKVEGLARYYPDAL